MCKLTLSIIFSKYVAHFLGITHILNRAANTLSQTKCVVPVCVHTQHCNRICYTGFCLLGSIVQLSFDLGLVCYYIACKEAIQSIINSLAADYHLHATCQSVIFSFLVKIQDHLLMYVFALTLKMCGSNTTMRP